MHKWSLLQKQQNECIYLCDITFIEMMDLCFVSLFEQNNPKEEGKMENQSKTVLSQNKVAYRYYNKVSRWISSMPVYTVVPYLCFHLLSLQKHALSMVFVIWFLLSYISFYWHSICLYSGSQLMHSHFNTIMLKTDIQLNMIPWCVTTTYTCTGNFDGVFFSIKT